ncbi:DUF4430 domain-containing protein [Streptococcus suis]|uniref:DUF4430 domain-containing protein n=1 Tax=Streptococcus suis TaxID=1307 RepID=A0A6L8MYX0_STRSU|nr:DUF4430 domain-containing protein [Streptococcus suis]
MKKISILLTLFLTFLLGACANTSSQTSGATIDITLQITNKDQVNRQEVTANQGDSVMNILKAHHDIEENNGLITKIDGISQDTSTNTYWMYKVNGKLAEKGANDLKVSDGDEIEFYLETFE